MRIWADGRKRLRFPLWMRIYYVIEEHQLPGFGQHIRLAERKPSLRYPRWLLRLAGRVGVWAYKGREYPPC